jgi:hypothetical protein
MDKDSADHVRFTMKGAMYFYYLLIVSYSAFRSVLKSYMFISPFSSLETVHSGSVHLHTGVRGSGPIAVQSY